MNNKNFLQKHDEYIHFVPKNNKKINKKINDKFNDNIDHENDNDCIINDFIKESLLKYIYNVIDLSNYKYKLIEYEYDLQLLKEKKYYVSPNYNGIHGLLVFIKIKDKFLSFIIDRKTLTYNINQIDYNKVKMIPIFYKLEENIYNGTIFDGVLLYNNIDGKKVFVINDIYYLMGKDMSKNIIINKILNISTYLETIKNDRINNNITFVSNKLYELKDIQQLVNMYIPKSKYNRSIKGISFYSEYSGTKLIYLYNNCAQEIVSVDNNIEKINQIKQFNIKLNVGLKTAIFKMKKTDIVDVYNLFLGQKINENNKKLFKYKKICIAYIPTKECSFFCKNIFEHSNELLVECNYCKEKDKWIPFKLITERKRPDLIDSIN